MYCRRAEQRCMETRLHCQCDIAPGSPSTLADCLHSDIVFRGCRIREKMIAQSATMAHLKLFGNAPQEVPGLHKQCTRLGDAWCTQRTVSQTQESVNTKQFRVRSLRQLFFTHSVPHSFIISISCTLNRPVRAIWRVGHKACNMLRT